MKKEKEAIKRLAGNPSDKKIEGCRIYGKSVMSYTKKDLTTFIIYLETERRRLLGDYLSEPLLDGRTANCKCTWESLDNIKEGK